MKYHTNLILGSAFVYIILSSFISQINWTFCIEWFAFIFLKPWWWKERINNLTIIILCSNIYITITVLLILFSLKLLPLENNDWTTSSLAVVSEIEILNFFSANFIVTVVISLKWLQTTLGLSHLFQFTEYFKWRRIFLDLNSWGLHSINF